jgi:cobalt-precorrin 5A hydrolase
VDSGTWKYSKVKTAQAAVKHKIEMRKKVLVAHPGEIIRPDKSEKLGIWIIRSEAETLGLSLSSRLDAVLYRSWLLPGSGSRERFSSVFFKHRQWLLIMAGGIAVRMLSGLPEDKLEDPAVCVMDEGGNFVVPLLCGHEGGANRLALRVSRLTGAEPVITTATESLKSLVIGIGTRRGVSIQAVEKAVERALGDRSLQSVYTVATASIKADEEAILLFCDKYNLPLRIFSIESLKNRGWVSESSDWVRQNLGIDGVCEPCALMTSPRSVLVVPKLCLDGVSVAVAEILPPAGLIGHPDKEPGAVENQSAIAPSPEDYNS